VITFDCYGTLIDWERGILGALQPVLLAHGVVIPDHEVLAAYSRIEPALQAGPYRPYREVLREVVAGFGREFDFTPTRAERDAIVNALPSWGPFPDTVDALRRLGAGRRLGILSNIDRDLFGTSAVHLQVRFDLVITAEDVRSYKPGHAHFQALLAHTGLAAERHLHAAESLFHDIAPANALGIPSAWVTRSRGLQAANASPMADAAPNLIVANLAELAASCAGSSLPAS
jgi:2-haloacid dehalogenase